VVMSSGLGRTHRSAACLDRATVLEDTPDQRKKLRGKGRGLAYLGSSDSSGFGRRHLRSPVRNSAAAWRRFCGRSEGNERGGRGLLIDAG
jgi:hypothetical protein